ncbi:DUF748 domain-containing protein [Jeongeupia sp. USM3]|uniref:DUF748 domain-containing protein n=1 Tax=Jeongeupia sp. USM3 TaxID=1906741 RepID=UPI00089E0522|nr:DUF748 domain-containing protein [Jeongeupia sp. USM3]AOY00445.1 hypothetical protein BJP62_08335 [Jeongeupia sp. USM3]
MKSAAALGRVLNGKRVRRVALVLLVVIALIGALGAGLLPWLAKPRIEAALSQALGGRQVTIGELAVNPFTLTARIDDFRVLEAGKPVLAFKQVKANATLKSLYRLAPVLESLEIDQPYFRLVRTGENRYNISDLIDKARAAPPSTGEPQRFAVYNIRVSGGRVDFDDRLLKQQHRVDAIDLGVPFVSNLPVFIDTDVEPKLSLKLDGAPFALSGTTKPFEDRRETHFALNWKDLDLARFWEYVPLKLDGRLSSGKLDSDLKLVFSQGKTQTLRLDGKLALNALAFVGGKDQPLLSVASIKAEAGQVEPLAGIYRLKSLNIVSPQLAASRDAAGVLNWQRLVPPAPATAKPAPTASAVAQEKAGEALRYSIGRFTLDDGRIDWRDAAVSPAVSTTLSGLKLHADGLGSDAKAPAKVEFSADGSHGEKLAATSQLTLKPLAATGTFTVEALPVVDYLPYYRNYTYAQPEAGTLGVAGNYQFAAGEAGPRFRLDDGKLHVAGARSLLDKQRVIDIDALDVDGIRYGNDDNTLQIARVGIDGGAIRLVRQADGKLNLQNLARTAEVATDRGASKRAAKAEKPIHVVVDKIALNRLRLSFEDRALEKPVPLVFDRIALDAGPFAWPDVVSTQLKLSARNGKGSLATQGALKLLPLSGKLRIDARGLDASPTQPYFAHYLNIDLVSGRISAKGDLDFDTASGFKGRYRGNAGIARLHAIDRNSGEDLLRWGNLALNGIDTRFDPLNIAVRDVNLSDYYARLVLTEKGQLNLKDIAAGDSTGPVPDEVAVAAKTSDSETRTVAGARVREASLPAAAPKPVTPVRVDKVTLAKGRINYTDLFIKPNYTANLTDMGGTITGLSSVDDTRARLDLKGSVDRIAPVTISGEINPLAKKRYIDIKAGVKGYELASASTYSAKYAGYGIEKGKLSMDVHYKIDDNKLKAENKLLLDQLTLGDKVDSPQATKLPVKFALSLLTDRRGQINVNLPIAGSLDDPDFSVGGLIVQVIVNLLEKAVTAPFDLIASAIGGGPSLSYVGFAPGSARLEPAAQDGIKQLAQALSDRPALKLEITGWVDRDKDIPGLRERMIRQRMRALKAKDASQGGESVDDIKISDAEKPELLKRVYKSADIKKPTNMIGLSKSLPPDEMEKILLAELPVSDTDLAQLADRRARGVKDALLAAGVSEDRLFLTRAKLDATAKSGDKDPSTRVQFKLQ